MLEMHQSCFSRCVVGCCSIFIREAITSSFRGVCRVIFCAQSFSQACHHITPVLCNPNLCFHLLTFEESNYIPQTLLFLHQALPSIVRHFPPSSAVSTSFISPASPVMTSSYVPPNVPLSSIWGASRKILPEKCTRPGHEFRNPSSSVLCTLWPCVSWKRWSTTSNTSREGKGPMFSLCSPPSTSPHLHFCECSSSKFSSTFHTTHNSGASTPLRRTHLEKRNSVSQFPKQSDLVTSFSFQQAATTCPCAFVKDSLDTTKRLDERTLSRDSTQSIHVTHSQTNTISL